MLIEYEDMFPYSGKLAEVRAPNAYTPEDIKTINNLAAKHNINIIPLVQTFGHMEFVLKLPQYNYLRENTLQLDSICPSDPHSLDLIDELVSQVPTSLVVLYSLILIFRSAVYTQQMRST